jgi:hypothetical protein
MQIVNTGKTVTGSTPCRLVKTSSTKFFIQIFVNQGWAGWETMATGNEEQMNSLFNRMIGE